MFDQDLAQFLLDVFLGQFLEPPLPESVGRFLSTDPPELQTTYESACEILEGNPSNIQALFERGVVCRTKGWYLQALADFIHVIRIDPRNAQAWLLSSEVLDNLGDYDKAREFRQKAVQLNPKTN